jgi:hypothetical protein
MTTFGRLSLSVELETLSLQLVCFVLPMLLVILKTLIDVLP